jgi:hypothetical protein
VKRASAASGDRIYRALLLLYPPSFRREYGAEMLQLFQDQRHDRGRRAWLSMSCDLLRSLPARHQEVIHVMNARAKLLIAAVALAIAIVAFAAIGGGLAALLLMLGLAWILFALLRERGATAPPGSWWKLALCGVGILALVFAVFAPPWPQDWREAVPGELAWWTGFFAVTTAIVCVAIGALGGLVELAARRRATR